MNSPGSTDAGGVFLHLSHLTDEHGLFEHSLLTEPRPEHGYCLDDVARALVVVCRERNPDRSVVLLAQRYLDFTLAAIVADGRCHNRMNVEGHWTDEPSLGDWWGRALWGLGVAAVSGPTAAFRARALLGFRRAARQRSPHLRAMVFAGLGAAELLLRRPAESSAVALAEDAATLLRSIQTRPGTAWPWPEARLSYANGSLVESYLLVGRVTSDQQLIEHGLMLLDFLLRTETRAGQLSVTPVAGRSATELQLGYDQQPIEVAALADACSRAYEGTGDSRWHSGLRLCWDWFLGFNDSSTAMFDPLTGGGYDGLEKDGCNQNQGAESTLAMLSTSQHAQRLGVLR